MSKIRVFQSDIKRLLESLPDNIKIPLKKDPITFLAPDQIIEQINNKTKIGKEYYLQLAEIIYKKKKDKTWKNTGDTNGIIL